MSDDQQPESGPAVYLLYGGAVKPRVRIWANASSALDDLNDLRDRIAGLDH